MKRYLPSIAGWLGVIAFVHLYEGGHVGVAWLILGVSLGYVLGQLVWGALALFVWRLRVRRQRTFASGCVRRMAAAEKSGILG